MDCHRQLRTRPQSVLGNLPVCITERIGASELETGTSGGSEKRAGTRRSRFPAFSKDGTSTGGKLDGCDWHAVVFRVGRLVARGGKEWTPIHKCHGVAEWSKSVLTNRRALLRQSLRVSMTNSPFTHFEIPIRNGETRNAAMSLQRNPAAPVF